MGHRFGLSIGHDVWTSTWTCHKRARRNARNKRKAGQAPYVLMAVNMGWHYEDESQTSWIAFDGFEI